MLNKIDKKNPTQIENQISRISRETDKKCEKFSNSFRTKWRVKELRTDMFQQLLESERQKMVDEVIVLMKARLWTEILELVTRRDVKFWCLFGFWS